MNTNKKNVFNLKHIKNIKSSKQKQYIYWINLNEFGIYCRIMPKG